MNANNPLHPLVFFFISVLLSFQAIRLAPRRGLARVVLSWELAAASFPPAIFAWAQAVYLTGKIDSAPARLAAAFLLLTVETSAASLALYWFVLRIRWRVYEIQRDLIVHSLVQSVLAALALWAGDFTFSPWLWFERLLMLAVCALVFPPAFFALEWRVAMSTVPRILKGKPILLISSGLLALGLLGLSGIF